MINRDSTATILGAIMAAGTAAQPIISAQSGAMHTGDWVQLATAVAMAVFGWFTNKPESGIIR